MNEPLLPPDEATLHAFVDGHLPPERVGAVLDHLRAQPDDAVRVAQWQAQRLALRQWHRSVDLGPLPRAVTQPVRRHLRRHAWRRMGAQALAAAVLLAVGMAAGWLGRGRGDAAQVIASPFLRDALAAHAVYVPEQRHPVEVAADQEAHLVTWLSRRLGSPLKAPQLQAQGFHLLGGRLLPAATGTAGESGARAQFMYEDAAAHRLTLYITTVPAAQAGETAFRSVQEGRLTAFYWTEGAFGYALSSELSAGELQTLAREVHRQLLP